MPATFFALRLGLALLFGLAGATKLLDQRRFRATLRDFGLDESKVVAIGFLVPGLELLASGLLLPAATATLGAALATLLLTTFSAAMLVVLRRGHAPDCGCFGSLDSTGVGAKAIGRNLLLTVAALVAARGDEVVHVPSAAGALVPMLSLVTIALAHRRRTKASPAVPVMARSARTNATDEGEASEDGRSSAGAPAFALTSVSGETVSLENLLAPGLPVVLVFASPDCQRCVALEADLGSWQRGHAATLTLAVISRGEVDANQHLAAAQGLRYVLVQNDREVAQAYDIRRTPAVVWVSPAGRVEAVAGPDPDTINGVILAAALEGRMAGAAAIGE